jgi:NAD(P)H-nitrite reductase large subunit
MLEASRDYKEGSMSEILDDDMFVCRCEEVTVREVKQAIAQGAINVAGVKLRTRSGMGLCQGRICEKMVQQILMQELGLTPDNVGSLNIRPPVRPITFGCLAGGEINE